MPGDLKHQSIHGDVHILGPQDDGAIIGPDGAYWGIGSAADPAGSLSARTTGIRGVRCRVCASITDRVLNIDGDLIRVRPEYKNLAMCALSHEIFSK